MSEVKHTPLPWRVVGEVMPECWQIENEEGDFIAQCEDRRGFASLDAPANARLIVQAVNSHGDLVEALRLADERLAALSDWINGLPIPTNGATRRMMDIRDTRTALSKVLELGEGL